MRVTLRDLPSRWRSRAHELEPYAPPAAKAFADAAAELEQALREADLEPLTLADAEIECGYTRSHLRRLIREGRIPNSGTEAEPRILRCHLPRKPGHAVAHARLHVASSRAQAARAVATGE